MSFLPENLWRYVTWLQARVVRAAQVDTATRDRRVREGPPMAWEDGQMGLRALHSSCDSGRAVPSDAARLWDVVRLAALGGSGRAGWARRLLDGAAAAWGQQCCGDRRDSANASVVYTLLYVLGVPFLPIIGTSSNPPARFGLRERSHRPVRGSRSVLSLSGQNVLRKRSKIYQSVRGSPAATDLDLCGPVKHKLLSFRGCQL
jgi:hypothetical protein